MRVSDIERQRTIEELRRHCAAGRIDVDEYAARIERALDATTFEELDQLLQDLPMLRIAEPAGLGSGAQSDAQVSAGLARRMTATAVVLVSVLMVVGVVIFALLAEWAWAVFLLGGWLLGVVQGRLSRTNQ